MSSHYIPSPAHTAATQPEVNTERLSQVLENNRVRVAAPEGGSHASQLWHEASRIARFRELPANDQLFIHRCLSLLVEHRTIGPGTAVTYARHASKVASALPNDPTGVRLLGPLIAFDESGVWNATDIVYNLRLAAVKAIHSAAIELGVLGNEPFARRKLKRIHRVAKAVPVQVASDALSALAEKLARFAPHADRHPTVLMDLTLLVLKTFGLRNVDLESMTRGTNNFVWPDARRVNDSKSQLGKRPVFLDPQSARLVDSYLHHLDRFAESKGVDLSGPATPLFIGTRLQPMSAKLIGRRLSALLPDDVRPHFLRGTMGTLLDGVLSQTDIAGVLGIRVDSVPYYQVPSSDQRVIEAVRAVRPSGTLDGIDHWKIPDSVSESLGSDQWMPANFAELLR